MAEKVLIEFEVDASGAIRQIRQLNQEVSEGTRNATTQANSGLLSMKNAVMALGAAFAASRVIDFLKEASREAAAEEAVFNRLGQTLRNAGVNYDLVSGALKNYFTEIQRTTMYTDDQAAGALQKLIGVTGSYKASLTGLNAAIDLAAGRNMDLEAASDLVGKAIAGNTAMLSRYGVVLTEAEKKMLATATATERAEFYAKKFNDQYGGVAQGQLETAAGQLNQLSKQYGELKQAIGQAINEEVFDPDMVGPLIDIMGVLADDVGETVLGIKIGFTSVMLLIAQAGTMAYQQLLSQARTIEQILRILPGGGLAAGLVGGVGDFFAEGAASLSTEIPLLKDKLSDLVSEFETYDDRVRKAKEDTDLLAGGAGEGGGNTGMAGLETKVKDVYKAIDDLSMIVARAGFEYLERQAEDSADMAARVKVEVDKVAESLRNMPDFVFIPTDAPSQVEQAVGAIKLIWADAAEQMGSIFRDHIGGALQAVFSGDIEGLTDVWGSFVGRMSEQFTDTFMSMVQSAFANNRNADGSINWGGVGSTLGGSGGFWQAGAGMVGAGLSGYGRQSGNSGAAIAGGALSGGVAGGMMAGAMMGSMGGWNWIGAVVGAVVGGVMGYLSSRGQDSPSSGFIIGAGGGVTNLRTADQGAGPMQQESFRRAVTSAYRAQQNAMLDVLRTFGDSSLFGLLGDLPGFVTGGAGEGAGAMSGGSLDQWLSMLTSDILPDIFQDWAQTALGTGLSQLGVSQGAQDALFEELAGATGTERLQALQSYVSAVVESSRLLGDLNWKEIGEEVGRDSLQSFVMSMQDVGEAIDTAMLGMEDMDLISRAQQAQEIEGLISQARQAEIQYLQQINQMQQAMNRSVEQQIEGLRLGGMDEGQQISYATNQVASLMERLGTATAPEEIAQIMADLQRYIGMIGQSAGGGLYSTLNELLAGQNLEGGAAGFGVAQLLQRLGLSGEVTGNETLADILIRILEDAQGTANEQFEAVRDRVAEANDALIAQLERLREALGITADGIFAYNGESDYTGDGANGPGPGGRYIPGGNKPGGTAVYQQKMLEVLADPLKDAAAAMFALTAFLAGQGPPVVNVIVPGSGGGGYTSNSPIGG